MPCAAPLQAWRPAAGGPIHFKQPHNGHAYWPIDIPCGICILCQQEKARQWGVRITHEAQLWEESCFVTLTYADQHLPEHNSLRYEDLVKFWKRLRKRHGKMRYYAVGEYGDESLRPHYHACIFGHAFTHNRKLLRTEPNLLWTQPELEAIWGKGNVSVGALTFETAQYTASYVLKKLAKHQQYVRIDEETGELIPLEQPRSFMSRNLAKGWWQQFGQFVRDHDLVVINGRKQKPPKAYDRWLAAQHGEEALEAIKHQRKENAPQETDQERRARARNAHARAKKKSKSV